MALCNQIHRIAIISEFFYPRCGGVEIHILSICKELIKKGHHVLKQIYPSFLGNHYYPI